MQIPMPTAPGGMTRGWMTCFVVDENEGDRLVVSAGHFPSGSQGFSVEFLKPKMKLSLELDVQRFTEGSCWDVALFNANDPSSLMLVPPLQIASDETVSIGDEVYIAGFPYSDLLTGYFRVSDPVLVTKKGVVGAKLPKRNGNGAVLILDVIWDVGMSGGPVIHGPTGHVIGLVSSRPQIDSNPMEIVWSPS